MSPMSILRQDLMVGNYVGYECPVLCDKGIYRVQTLSHASCDLIGVFTDIHPWALCDHLHPIRVDEWWLEVLGFEPSRKKPVWTDTNMRGDPIYMPIQVHLDENKETYSWRASSTRIPIHWVHQLQNLHYAINGIALEASVP